MTSLMSTFRTGCDSKYTNKDVQDSDTLQELQLLLSIQYSRRQAFDLFQPPMTLVPASIVYQNKPNTSFLQFDTASETLDLFLACPPEASFCSAVVTAVYGIYVSAFLDVETHFFEEQGGSAGFTEAVASYLNISAQLLQVVNPSRVSGGPAGTGRYSLMLGIDTCNMT